jgi:30S ribosomal protein S31
MGKGDRRTAKGKRNIGTYGNSRKKKALKAKANKGAASPKGAKTAKKKK